MTRVEMELIKKQGYSTRAFKPVRLTVHEAAAQYLEKKGVARRVVKEEPKPEPRQRRRRRGKREQEQESQAG